MVVAYIGLGSNLGDGMTSNHWFTNAVGRLRVTLTPLELLQSLLTVEASFGRLRKERSFGYQDRSLDLDLLYYGDVAMDSPELILPHPRISERLFVLEPMAELEPDFVDNFRGESITTLVERLRAKVDTTSNREQEIVRSTWNERH